MPRRKREAATDETSNDEVKSRVKPRPRKKQAVTKTNSTAIKALIRKNAATSPLLLLPPEVRENILIHLVGDKLFHIKYFDATTRFVAISAEDEFLDAGASEDSVLDELPSYAISDTDNHYHDDSDNSDDSNTNDIDTNEATLLFPGAFSLASFKQVHTPPAFRHAICVANQSEQSAYQEAISGHAVVPEGESPEFYVSSCEKRHATCKMRGSGPMSLCIEDRQALRVDLNVLGVCRQLYEEANHLLWATNTFSFEDPKTFKNFFGNLNPAQKRNLTSIHFSVNIGGYGFHYTNVHQRARRDKDYWGTALNMSNLKMLRGVQALHLSINQTFKCVSPVLGNISAEQQIEDAQQTDMNSILRLRALSVKHVTVIVSDDARKLDLDGRSNYRWTAIKKNEYAESIRVQLVDPSGAEIVKTEAETATLARKTEIKDNAAARVRTYKLLLKEKQANVIRLAKWASRVESKVALAAQKANQASKKGLKKAAKLHLDARILEEKAADARETAGLAVEKEKLGQEQLAKAREKYKRASARLGATPEDIQDEEDVELLMEGLSGSGMGPDPQSEDDESLVSQPEDEASDDDDDSDGDEALDEDDQVSF